jgi:hypothetical protein
LKWVFFVRRPYQNELYLFISKTKSLMKKIVLVAAMSAGIINNHCTAQGLRSRLLLVEQLNYGGAISPKGLSVRYIAPSKRGSNMFLRYGVLLQSAPYQANVSQPTLDNGTNILSWYTSFANQRTAQIQFGLEWRQNLAKNLYLFYGADLAVGIQKIQTYSNKYQFANNVLTSTYHNTTSGNSFLSSVSGKAGVRYALGKRVVLGYELRLMSLTALGNVGSSANSYRADLQFRPQSTINVGIKLN